MQAERIWLDVPYAEKDAAKAQGARWDPNVKRWYAPRPAMTGLQPWAALPELPDTLPGEDRTFGEGLYVDLIPSTCWFTNVRSCVSQRDWQRVRRMVTGRAGRRCEACGLGEKREYKIYLEAHERWHYDEARRVQTLRRLICLCSDCHQATHYGHAAITGHAADADLTLTAVTRMDEQQLRAHIDEAFALWEERSRHDWHLDLSILTDAGITLAPPPKARQRAGIADRTLDAVRTGEKDTEHAPAAAPTDPPTNPIPVQRPAPATPPSAAITGTVSGDLAGTPGLPAPYQTGRGESRLARWFRRR